MRRAATAGSAIATCAGIFACVSPAVLPVEFVEPASGPDGAAAVGPLRVAASTGPEWIELRLRNTGEGQVIVDWTASELVTPGGRRHALVREEELSGHFKSYEPWRPGVPFEHLPVVAFPWAIHPGLPPGPRMHTVPEPLRRERPHQTLLPPFGEHREYLHPAEHVVMDANGFFVTELFCDGDGAGRTFSMVLRVATDGRWRDVLLRGRPREAAGPDGLSGR